MAAAGDESVPRRRRGMPVTTSGRACATDETLLRALCRAGLRYRVGCKRGGCGICKVQLVLGEVRYERPIAASVLTDDERVEGICLSCRAVPLTNIVIELQEGDRLRRVLDSPPELRTEHRIGTRARTEPTQRRQKEGKSDGYDECRHPAGLRAPAGDRPRRGPQPLLQHPGHGGRARGARQAVAQVLGRVGPPLPGAGGGRRRAGQVRLQGRERRRPGRLRAPRPAVRCRPPAGSARARTSRSATGVRITLPSEHTLELYTDMEFTGTETGAINPEAWPRNMRGVGTHWIDHALIAAEDPGLSSSS